MFYRRQTQGVREERQERRATHRARVLREGVEDVEAVHVHDGGVDAELRPADSVTSRLTTTSRTYTCSRCPMSWIMLAACCR